MVAVEPGQIQASDKMQQVFDYEIFARHRLLWCCCVVVPWLSCIIGLAGKLAKPLVEESCRLGCEGICY